MINSGYFTSRNQILEWLSQLLELNITKIEQLGSGSLYCQVLDAAYPYKVPLNKIKWNAQTEVQFLHNFRILQTAFERLGIGRTIETQKLVKAKYQDNLQFIQWMKWHLSPLITKNLPYEAASRRGNVHVHLIFSTDKTEKRMKEDKENMVKSVGSVLKSYKSVQQFKPISKERTLEKGVSMRVLNNENTKQNIDMKKGKKAKLEVTLKPLQQRNMCNIPVVESDEEECF